MHIDFFVFPLTTYYFINSQVEQAIVLRLLLLKEMAVYGKCLKKCEQRKCCRCCSESCSAHTYIPSAAGRAFQGILSTSLTQRLETCNHSTLEEKHIPAQSKDLFLCAFRQHCIEILIRSLRLFCSEHTVKY